MHRIFITLTLLAAAASLARAGAWLQEPGASYAKLSWLSQSADERWDCRGDEIPADPAGSFEQWQLFAYGEYGLRRWMTLVASWAYKDQRIAGSNEYGTRGTGDLRLGARLPILRGRRPISFEGTLGIPTYARSSLLDPPAERAQYLPAGSGRVEAELRLLGGASLWPLPLYLNAGLGFRARGGEFSDQWLGTLELGGSAASFFAKSELSLQIPRQEGCGDGGEAAGTVALGERAVVLSGEASIRARGKLWMGAGYAVPLTGRQSLIGGMLSFSLALWGG